MGRKRLQPVLELVLTHEIWAQAISQFKTWGGKDSKPVTSMELVLTHEIWAQERSQFNLS
jgi:hypothetical protein